MTWLLVVITVAATAGILSLARCLGVLAPVTDPSAVRAVYRERAELVAWLASLYPAVLCDDPSQPDCPAIVYLSTPRGQLSWHVHDDDLTLFEHVSRVPRGHRAAQWDGHSSEVKYQRIARLVHDRQRSRR